MGWQDDYVYTRDNKLLLKDYSEGEGGALYCIIPDVLRQELARRIAPATKGISVTVSRNRAYPSLYQLFAIQSKGGSRMAYYEKSPDEPGQTRKDQAVHDRMAPAMHVGLVRQGASFTGASFFRFYCRTYEAAVLESFIETLDESGHSRKEIRAILLHILTDGGTHDPA